MTGPLTGVRVVLLAGLGPVPFTAMLLDGWAANARGGIVFD
jgi:crotonobetainyl-CoA:carnitine CoA-transferase CaiB-like acyl-CoA transferase